LIPVDFWLFENVDFEPQSRQILFHWVFVSGTDSLMRKKFVMTRDYPAAGDVSSCLPDFFKETSALLRP